MAIQDFTAGQILTAAQMDSLQANDYNQTVSTKTASYTLVAADKGTRVAMNSASATTITVNTSIFNAGDTLFIQNIGAGTCTITAGTATVTTASSLALAQWGGGTLYFTSAGAAIFFSGGGTGYGAATGGSSSSITVGGINYTLLTFTSTGTLTVTKAGFFDFCAVGGGGGNASYNNNQAGGGGGSGCLQIASIYLDANQTITIGAGSAANTWNTLKTATNTTIAATSPFTQTIGGNTAFANGAGDSILLIGGGQGSIAGQTSGTYSSTSSYGFKGGNSTSVNNAGGGGGFSGAGGNGSSTTGGAAGAGFDISGFTGTTQYVAMGGGGGGTTAGGAAASGGVAGSTNSTPSNGNANTGGGGGGGVSSTTTTTGNGGSGVCYIRFK